MDGWVRVGLGVTFAVVVSALVALGGDALWGPANLFDAPSGGALVRDVLVLLGIGVGLAAVARKASAFRADGRWASVGYRLTLAGLLLLGLVTALFVLSGGLEGGIDLVTAPEMWVACGVLAVGVALMVASRSSRVGDP